jgi:hypothetical protein
MSLADRIDNKRNLRSSLSVRALAIVEEGGAGMRLVSPRMRLAAVAVGAVIAAAVLGGCPWGP